MAQFGRSFILGTAVTAALLVAFVAALPVKHAVNSAHQPARRTTAAPTLTLPRKVVYVDYRDVDWNNGAETVTQIVDDGYNVVVIAFWLSTSGAVDMAQVWGAVPAEQQIAAVNYAHSKGAIVMVSAGGSTDLPWKQFSSGTAYGTAVGQWAAANNLDGVDFDVENFGPGFTASPLTDTQLVQFLADASIAAKKYVSFVSHAPQAPYFGKIGEASMWPGKTGGYSSVEASAQGAVDWYNVQYYNQGGSCYTTYDGIFQTSVSDCASFPGTSVAEIASYGVPLEKVTVTKYLETSDASNGYVSAADLATFVSQARTDIDYTAGMSCWMWAQATSAQWIATIYPASN